MPRVPLKFWPFMRKMGNSVGEMGSLSESVDRVLITPESLRRRALESVGSCLPDVNLELNSPRSAFLPLEADSRDNCRGELGRYSALGLR